MRKYIENIVDEISESYYNSAIKYYTVGIGQFHEVLSSEWDNYQPAVGNLTISLELLFKSIIAKSSLVHLYKNLPKEAQLYIVNPEIITDIKSFRRYEIEIKSSNYSTIDFKDCVGIIYSINPPLKIKYKSQLAQMSEIRNKSVHSFLPDFQKYDLSRIGFLVLTIFKELVGTRRFNYYNNNFAKQNEKFLKNYSDKRISRVKKLIEDAKEKSRNLNHTGNKLPVDSWWEYAIKCPICKSNAILEGDTEIEYLSGEESLIFYAGNFHCSECELKLGSEDFELASIDSYYDRSDELDEWNNDFPFEPDYEHH